MIKVLQELMEKNFDFSGQEVPEEIVDTFVESIIVYKDYFGWNLRLTDEQVCCNVEGNNEKVKLSPLSTPMVATHCTGSIEQ